MTYAPDRSPQDSTVPSGRVLDVWRSPVRATPDWTAASQARPRNPREPLSPRGSPDPRTEPVLDVSAFELSGCDPHEEVVKLVVGSLYLGAIAQNEYLRCGGTYALVPVHEGVG